MLSGGPLASLFDSYDFQPDATYVAAVSGGSDSTALLFLLKTHFDRSYPGARLVAATVDHGLRAESATEAEAVGELCRENGIEHETLKWVGEKPLHGISAAARIARHQLLADLATQQGAAAVFTGHTRDDQAETILMRSARGDGLGKAGIASATLYDGRVWFLRPLLNVRRAELRGWLRKRGLAWVDDPSNSDARFERARLRAKLRDVQDGDAQIDEAVTEGANAAALRMARAQWTAALLRLHAKKVAPGLIRLERDVLHGSHETVIHALRVLVAIAGGAQHLPDARRAELLLTKLRAGNLRATLSGALIDARKDAIFFLRESRGLPQEAVHPGTIWDRRYEISVEKDGGRVDSPRTDMAPESLMRAAAKVEPVMPDNYMKKPVLAPWIEFLPDFDLVLADEAAGLVGAKEVLAPPLRGHNKNSA